MVSVQHPIFAVLAIAVAAPLIAELPLGVRLPVVVIEVVLGAFFGPHGVGWIATGPFLDLMQTAGLGAMLFMAGTEIDFRAIAGRPLRLGIGGWFVSAVLAFVVVGLLHVVPGVHAPMMVVLALTTTNLGVMLPVLRDAGVLDSAFGRQFLAAGTIGELAPIVAVSLALSTLYSTWQEFALLLAFLGVVAATGFVGARTRAPRLLAWLSRTLQSSSQTPIRISLLLLASFFVLSEAWGFEGILGAFAAGMVIGVATRGEECEDYRMKLEAVIFGWLVPFFFVGTGLHFDVAALWRSTATLVLLPTFLVLLLLVRGAPALLYRNELPAGQRVPFALSSSVASVGLVIVITEIGKATQKMNPDVAQALVAAALLSVLVFPTVAGSLLGRQPAAPAVPAGDGRTLES
ncbi:MAG: cation:proton antiporter [Burkholderiales bacterium]